MNHDDTRRTNPIRAFGESEGTDPAARKHGMMLTLNEIVERLPVDEPVYDTSGDIERAHADIGSIDPDSFATIDGETWWRALRDAVINEEHSKALRLIDSLPQSLKDLKHVGQTHVIVPHPDHMTEDMIDASRRLLLYTDTFGTHDTEYLTKILSHHDHTANHLPQWFKEHSGHVTKGSRAALAYHLTIMDYLDPPKPEEVRTKRLRKPMPGDQRLSLVLKHKTLLNFEVTLGYAYETSIFDKTIEILDVQTNRHELPDAWKAFFKKQAIDISARVSKDDKGIYRIGQSKVRLGLKAEHAGDVTFELSDGSEKLNTPDTWN